MSEKFELIDAKDLPVTEEEDVTVLCVGADGEMKRKYAGSFGMKASELDEKLAEKISAPATASVGQTIKVSVVDENGKPTAWEAVDTPVDVVIKITKMVDSEPTAELIEGTYETILRAFEENKIINVSLFYVGFDPATGRADYYYCVHSGINAEGPEVIYTSYENYIYYIRPDNTIELEID